MKNIITLLTLLVAQPVFAQVTIGFSSECDYDENQNSGSIQLAIDDGHSEIRVSNELEFTTPIIITDDLILKGGYNNCSDAQTDTQSNTLSVIDGSLLSQSIVKIDTNSAVRNIVIDSFELKNSSGGNANNGNHAGGMSIYQTSGNIQLTNLYIHHNLLNFASGGVAIKNDHLPSSSGLQVDMTDVLITENSGNGSGGGLGCRSNGNIVVNIFGESGVSFNHSDFHGGGILLSNCRLNLYSGTSTPSTKSPLGIHGNSANKRGGGIVAFNGSTLTLTGSSHAPVNITDNTANIDELSSDDGGGIMAGFGSDSQQTTVNAYNVLIAGNHAINSDGGAVYAEFGASVNISSTTRNCAWSQFCSLFDANIAKIGGAVAIEQGASVVVNGTEFKRNRTNLSGPVATLRDDNSMLTIENSLIHHNGGIDHSEFADSYLIRNMFGDNQTTIAYSTIVDNDVQYNTLSPYNGSDGTLRLYGSIIDDSPVRPMGIPAAAFTGEVNCVILSDDLSVSNIPLTDHIFVKIPSFVDRINADYHLDPMFTVGIDQCPQNIYFSQSSIDIDKQVRVFDHPDFINNPGLIDIGVDEVIPDLIFKGLFE